MEQQQQGEKILREAAKSEGKRLEIIREKLGFSKIDFGKILGFKGPNIEGSYNNVANGTKPISGKSMRALFKAYPNINIGWFFGSSKNHKSNQKENNQIIFGNGDNDNSQLINKVSSDNQKLTKEFELRVELLKTKLNSALNTIAHKDEMIAQKNEMIKLIKASK